MKQRGEVLDGLLKDAIDPEFARLASRLARRPAPFATLGFLKDRDPA